MKKFNKIVSVFLIVILLIGIIPLEHMAMAFGSTETIIYQTPTLEVGVINKKALELNNFMRDRVYNLSNDFNLVNKFKLISSKNIKGGASNDLSYNSSFIHKGNGSGWFSDYVMDYSVYPNLKTLINLNQIKVNITGSLALDNHSNFSRHWKKKKDKAVVELVQTNLTLNKENKISEEKNSSSDPDQSPVVYGKDIFGRISNSVDYKKFLIKLHNDGCKCGSSKVNKLSFCMLDDINPYIQNIYTTGNINDGEGNIKERFIKDEIGYIHLKFTEPIRFANNIAPEFGKYTLMFNLLNTENNQEVSGHGLSAVLVALQNNTLTFRFVTPATIGDSNTNHYISDILSSQNWVDGLGNESFDLVILDDGGKAIDMSKYPDLTKTNSLITDLSGNPVELRISNKGIYPNAYLDNVIPYINTVEISGTNITRESTITNWPEDIDRSAVFAGIGDSINFHINLNEEIYLGDNDVSTIKATLNTNKNGSPIILTAKSSEIIKNGINGINVSRITFESLTITEDMINSGEISAIAITKVSVPNGVYDLRGNEIASNINVSIKPKQQQWLDTLTPNITTSINADSENKYTPIYYDSNNTNEFYFPINITDNNTRGAEYTSGSNGAKGNFIWSSSDSYTNYQFEYYVSATTTKPNKYSKGIISTKFDFTQVDGGNYIHIKLYDDVKYNFDDSTLVISGLDYAGNVCISYLDLNYNPDKVAPIYEQAGFSTMFNSTTSQGAITAKIKISDNGGINPDDILYQWVNKGVDYAADDWQIYPSGETSKSNEYLITVEKGMLSDNALHEYDLWLKCTDINGNEKIEKFSYLYDLTRAANNIDIVTDPTKPIAHPIIAVENAIGRDLTGTGEITPGITLFMIKNPNLSNEYFMRVISSSNPEQITDVLRDTNYDSWYAANVYKYADGYSFTNVETIVGDTSDLIQIRDNYYGILEFTAITGYGIFSIDNLPEFSIDDDRISVENFTVKSSAITSSAGDRPIHSISMHDALMSDGSDVAIKYTNVPDGAPDGIGYSYVGEYIPNGEHRFMSSLDGIQIPFTITNNLIPDWGVDDVDFESDETYAVLYYTKNGRGIGDSVLEEVYRASLTPKTAQQNFVIPEGVANKTGFYCFEVSVKAKDKSQTIVQENSRIFLNAENIEEDYGFYGGVTTYYLESKLIDRETYLTQMDKTEVPGVYSNIFNLGTLDSTAIQTYWTLMFGRYLHDMYENSMKYYKEYKSTDYEIIQINDNACFKVWNSADTDGYNNAPWSKIYKDVVFVNNAGEINASLYEPSYEYGSARVPVIRGIENTILYQMKLENGIMSPIRQLTINTSNIGPTFEVSLSPDKPLDGNMVPEVLGTIQSVFSVNGLYETGCKRLPSENNEETYSPDYSNNLATIKHNGEYLFYAVDNLGNITTSIKAIDYIDSIAPTVEIIDNGSKENEFNLLIKVTDNYEMNGGEIYLSFDADYSSILVNEEEDVISDNTIVTVTVPHNNQGGSWYANSASNNGIYYTNTTFQSVDGNHTKLVEIRGVFKFDVLTDDEIIERTFTITASDKAGVLELNEEQNPKVLTILSKNIIPKFIDSSLTSENKVKLNFTAPVIMDKPRDTSIDSIYSSSIDSLPIYSDGEYSISYIDVFGNLYEENIKLTPYGDFNIKVNVSQEEPTINDVIVSLDALEKEGLTIEAIDGSISEDIKISADKKTASVVMRQNSTLIVTLKNNGVSKTRSIVISNIDKEAPIVSEYLYYTAGEPLPGETTTDGDVIAGIICDEDLDGLNGPLTYTFTYGGPTSYTFKFSDLAGNEGELTVNLQHTINDPNIEDNTPSSYELDVYAKINNAMSQIDTFLSWDSQKIEDFIRNLPGAQGYMLNLIPQDESHVKLIVKNGLSPMPPSYEDVSDSIEGLIIGERSIVIDKNTECTIFLVDIKGNSINIPLSITKLDNTAPKTEIIYVPVTFYSIRAYLKEIGVPVDPNCFIITNLSGVSLDDGSGEYKGLYYHDFNENESFVFYYKDGVGNADTKNALVSVLDTTPARVENVVWSPINPTTTKNLINKNITAKVQFNKTVKAIALDWANEADKTKNINDYISVNLLNDGVIITYKQNTPMIKLKFTSLNNKEATSSLPEVNCIDNIAPNITIGTVNLSKDKKSASFTITSDKEVSFAEGISPAIFATSFTKNVTENGLYVCSFTDRAGNYISITVSITEIDNENLVLIFNTAASDTGATTKANELNVKVGDTFYIKMNKNGVILFNGRSVNVTANSWCSFVIEQSTKDALYVMKATDERGDTYYAYLNITPVDMVAPTIMLKNSTISIMKAADSKVLADALNENVILSDNVTLSENIVFSYDISSVDLNIEGIYTVNYKATDEGGNLKEVSGYIRVYDKDDLDIMINGTKAIYNSTLVVNSKDITLDIKNINGEPYTVYYKAGIKTEGQMKIGSTVVTGKSLSLSENGYYTVYVITQNRRSFITYIYVEQ